MMKVWRDDFDTLMGRASSEEAAELKKKMMVIIVSVPDVSYEYVIRANPDYKAGEADEDQGIYPMQYKLRWKDTDEDNRDLHSWLPLVPFLECSYPHENPIMPSNVAQIMQCMIETYWQWMWNNDGTADGELEYGDRLSGWCGRREWE
jgi:hypothetical protein